MAISDKTRKFLWAKSGNLCAICKTELVTNGEFNIGEECHIISSKILGPRHIPGLKDYDKYENLILLCRNHHKEIDELVDTYTEEIIRYIKTNHESKVRSTLGDAMSTDLETEKPRFLSQVTSGKDLFNIIHNVYGFNTDYDESKDESEMDYIAGILQSLIDYGDKSGMVETSDHIKMAFNLQRILDDLNNRGYMLFAERGLQPMFPDNPRSTNWTVATLILRKRENPEIIKV